MLRNRFNALRTRGSGVRISPGAPITIKAHVIRGPFIFLVEKRIDIAATSGLRISESVVRFRPRLPSEFTPLQAPSFRIRRIAAIDALILGRSDLIGCATSLQISL